jgi:hypothetical protein
MSFAVTRLQQQAERRGCTVSELRCLYEQAADRLRAGLPCAVRQSDQV